MVIDQYWIPILLLSLIGPFAWWLTFGFIGDFPDVKTRKIWIATGVYSAMALIFLMLYLQH